MHNYLTSQQPFLAYPGTPSNMHVHLEILMILNVTLAVKNFLSQHQIQRSSMAERVRTRGGYSFDQLGEEDGDKYVYFRHNLVDIRGLTQLKHAKNKIADKIEDIIISLENGGEQRVAKIYIGKTYIRCEEPQEGQDQKVDPMESSTWSLGGITSGWNDHIKNEEGYAKDGIIVLAAVTKEAIPSRCRDRIKKEDYAIAIKQALLHHFRITTTDQRVVNKTFHPGKLDWDKSPAYAIYMTFALEERAKKEPAKLTPPTSLEDQGPTPSAPPTDSNSPKEVEKVKKQPKCPSSKTKANDKSSTPAQPNDPADKPPPQDKSPPQVQTVGLPANQGKLSHKPTK